MQHQTRLGSTVIFVVLSSCIVLLSHADVQADSSESLSNLYLDSSFEETPLGSATPDFLAIASDPDLFTSLDPYYTDSSDDILLPQFEPDLLLSSNEACSIDSSSIDDESIADAGGDLDLFGKRGVRQSCKASQRNSKQTDDPANFLNNLPIFRPPIFSDFREDKQVCNPYLVGDLSIPVCWFGGSDRSVKGDWNDPDALTGCTACMSCTFYSRWGVFFFFGHASELTILSILDDPYSVSGCPSNTLLLCCREADMNDDFVRLTTLRFRLKPPLPKNQTASLMTNNKIRAQLNAVRDNAGIRPGVMLNSDNVSFSQMCQHY